MTVLKPYFDLCVDRCAISKDTCRVFDVLSTYVPKEESDALQPYLKKMGLSCKQERLYEEASRYFALLITFDSLNHEYYWNLLQCKMGCSSDDEMIYSSSPISDFVEFENAKLAAGNDRSALSRYIDVEDKQRQYKEYRQRAEKEKALQEEKRKREEEEKRLLIARKRRKKIALISSFSFLGIIAVVLGAIGIGNIANNSRKTPEESTSYPLTPTVVGDYVYYGLYPQTHVNDADTIFKLNSLIYSPGSGWYELDGKYYAKKSATPYPQDTGYKYSDGTVIWRDKVDWFLCEPIKWRILSESNGEALVVSDLILDTHGYNEQYEGLESGHYANNYKRSEIRQWLNDGFYDSAFSLDSSSVLTTTVDNSASTTDVDDNEYACENTQDKVFLLSFQDYLDPSYGFSDSAFVVNERKCMSTDWAAASGVYKHNGDGFGWYWTRSPSSSRPGNAYCVSYKGDVQDCAVDSYSSGVRPAIRLKLDSGTNQSASPTSDSYQSASPTSDPDISELVSGDYISYGLYPQTHVGDSKIIDSLNAIPAPESNGWYLLNEEYYAKKLVNPSGSDYKYSDGSLATSGSSDWFRCEPIEWKILSINNGEALVVSDLLIDAHRYNEYYDGLKDGHYANNYKYSEIRQWLNDDFYGSAFSLDSSSVLTTEVDNSAPTTDSNSNQYACENTEDNVFLLSYKDYTNTAYGFSSSTGNSDSRKCKPTDWALANGAYQNSNGYGYYYTRSPYFDISSNAWSVYGSGTVFGDSVDGGLVGVRPALRLKIEKGSTTEKSAFSSDMQEIASTSVEPEVVGDSVYYGMYPQIHVNDKEIIASLNAISPKSNGWYLLDGEYYAKKSANPHESGYKYSDGFSVTSGSSDWFRCEPIEWKILSQSGDEALVVSNVLLDVRRYSEEDYSMHLPNNYKESEIRQWLNDDFYGSAFSLDSSSVLMTEVDNSASTTDSNSNLYACENTQDKVFLLNYQDYLNESYGFYSDKSSSDTRKCGVTDWALANGAYQNNGYGQYFTRSPHSGFDYGAWFVNTAGSLIPEGVDISNSAVRPALRLKIA